MVEKATIPGFARAFATQWFTLMSGAMSVPLAIAAYFVRSEPARFGLVITSVACFVVASYRMWSEERNNRLEAEIKFDYLSTKARMFSRRNTNEVALKIYYSEDDENCNGLKMVGSPGTRRRTISVAVENIGDGWISNCRLFINKTYPSIHDSEWPLASGFTIQAGDKQYVKLLYFDEEYPDGHSADKALLPQAGGWGHSFGVSKDETVVFFLKAEGSGYSATAAFRASIEGNRLSLERI